MLPVSSQQNTVRKITESNKNRVSDVKKVLVVTIHSTKIKISSNINLKICCSINDSETHSTNIKSVDPATRVANFDGQKLSIRLDQVRLK